MAFASAQPSSLVTSAKKESFYSPQFTRLLKADAWPYLLHDLSVFHVKLDNVHMAEGDDTEGPYHPRAIGIHHLVMDAVTERRKKKHGAIAEATGQGHPQGSPKLGCQAPRQTSETSSPQTAFVWLTQLVFIL